MAKKKFPDGHWQVKENCAAAAKECRTRNEFHKRCGSAYTSAWKHGWLDDICGHMKTFGVQMGHWQVKKNCADAALKCTTSSEFHKKFSGAAQESKRRGWWEEITKHFTSPHVKRGHWQVKENCAKAALECSTPSEFCKKYPSAYKSTLDHGWDDEIFAHFTSTQKRNGYWQVKQNCIDVVSECSTLEEFNNNFPGARAASAEKGWYDEITANLTRFRIKWGTWENKENCATEALKYTTMSDFVKGSPGAIKAARKNGWVDEITAHFVSPHLPKGHWFVKENCIAAALECSTLSELHEKYARMFIVATENGWYEEITAHITRKTAPRGYCSKKENCAIDALECSTRKEFRAKFSGSYKSAMENKWLDDICAHMPFIQHPHGYWDKDKCSELAINCKTRMEFHDAHGGAYCVASKNGWLDEICSHMEPSPIASDADIVYVIAPLDNYQGEELFKLGVSSNRCVDRRIQTLDQRSPWDNRHEVIAKVHVEPGTGYEVEKKMHSFGVNPHFTGHDGATEYRALDTEAFSGLTEYLTSVMILQPPRLPARSVAI